MSVTRQRSSDGSCIIIPSIIRTYAWYARKTSILGSDFIGFTSRSRVCKFIFMDLWQFGGSTTLLLISNVVLVPSSSLTTIALVG